MLVSNLVFLCLCPQRHHGTRFLKLRGSAAPDGRHNSTSSSFCSEIHSAGSPVAFGLTLSGAFTPPSLSYLFIHSFYIFYFIIMNNDKVVNQLTAL